MTQRPTAFPYCRDHDLVAPLEEFAQSILRGLAEEAYWFHWQSSFDGEATIRAARLGGEAEFSRLHRGSHFGRARMCRGVLSMTDWALIEDAVVAAEFWLLDKCSGARGLDGATWSIAGRRRREYHFVTRWSPQGALWDLGRLLFDLAGLEEVRI